MLIGVWVWLKGLVPIIVLPTPYEIALIGDQFSWFYQGIIGCIIYFMHSHLIYVYFTFCWVAQPFVVVCCSSVLFNVLIKKMKEVLA